LELEEGIGQLAVMEGAQLNRGSAEARVGLELRRRGGRASFRELVIEKRT
jgi:hypothetical protein